MSAPRWREARALFDAALDRPPDARRCFVEAACPDRSSLVHEVVSLLDAHRHADGFLERPRAVEDGEADPVLATGRIGPYRVSRRLGEGGMGVVYAGESERGRRRKVAIKLIRPGPIAAGLAKRFRAERAILAELRHPNIARILDGGNADDGSPYLVLEHVEGVPIHRYVKSRGATVAEIVRLFLPLCSAVHYAHRHLVIHRDIKPSNVLVTARGVPKLLDFGIAKLLDPQRIGCTMTSTWLGGRPMTLAYASPEQVRGEAATPATDIYALGVLLYELLTGTRPYRLRGGSQRELEAAICEQIPLKPSAAALAPGDGPRGGDLAHPTRRRSLGRQRSARLRGALDTIVLTALRKEPQRRHRSVRALADDLDRYLRGLPVSSPAEALRDRLGRLANQHPIVLATLALIVAALTLASAFVVQHRRLIGERDRASHEARRSQEVSDFVVGLFEGADRGAGFAEGLELEKRKHLLDVGVERLATELGDQPDIRATLMTTIGSAFRDLALYDRSTPLLEGALAIRRTRLGEHHLKVAASLDELSRLRLARGRFDAAEAMAEQALDLRARHLGTEHAAFASSLENLGSVRLAQLDAAGAEPLLRRALAIRRRLFGEQDPRVAQSLESLALAFLPAGRYTASEPLLRRALSMRSALFGPDHPALASSLHNLAWTLEALGNYRGAEPLYRRSLEINRRAVGNLHPQVAQSQHQLAKLLQRQGMYAQAERLFRRVLAINETLQGGEHPDVAGSLNSLGLVLRDQGRFDEAEPLLRRALAINRRVLRPGHPSVTITLEHLAGLLAKRGDLAAAEPIYREALAQRRREDERSRAHPHLGRTLHELATLLAATGRAVEGERLARESIDVLESVLPATNWRPAMARNALGACLVELGRFAEAEPLLLESYAPIRHGTGLRSPASAIAHARILALYDAWDRPDRKQAFLPPHVTGRERS